MKQCQKNSFAAAWCRYCTKIDKKCT